MVAGIFYDLATLAAWTTVLALLATLFAWLTLAWLALNPALRLWKECLA
jgi:hypothetical protein